MNNKKTISIKEVVKLTRLKKYDDALVLVDEFIACFPLDVNGYREKVAVLSLMKKYQQSALFSEKLIVLGTNEPCDFYNLSQTYCVMGDNEAAVKYAKRGIDLCIEHNVFYYFKACQMQKALALVNLGHYQEALTACSYLEAEYDTYFVGKGMVSKEDLEQQCHANLNRQSKRQTSWRFDED